MARGCNGFAVNNTLGQSACADADLASGYYLYDNEAVAAMNADNSNPCGPTGIRPGFIVIRGAGRVNTCAGRVLTEQLPDMILVNSRYRFWLLLGLVLLAAGALTGAVVSFTKWLKR